MKWWPGALKWGGNLPDFTGKAVAICCSSERGGGVFEDVRIVLVGFTHFVVGRQTALEPHQPGRRTNVTSWFSINDISQIHVCDDIDAARSAYERIMRYPWLGVEPDPLEPE